MFQITLKAARVNAGFSNAKEVAKIVNKSVDTIRNWENGDTVIPTDMFYKLCDLYGIDPDFIKVPVRS